MRDGGRVLLAVINLCVGIKMRLATFDAGRSVTGSTQTVNRCFSPAAACCRSPVC